MNKNYSEDNFLAKWLSGNLSKEELKSFEESEDYLAYADILKGTERLKKPIFNVEEKLKEQKAFNNTYKNRNKTKIKSLVWLYSAAALVLVFIGARFLFFGSTTKIQTKIAQTNIITLPDNSVVTLNANSSLTYNKESFTKKRILNLKGAAFFDVAKGASFTVHTKNGDITVLGTEFDVYARKQLLEVNCFEGKVSVLKGIEKTILTAGEGTKYDLKNASFATFNIYNEKPVWLAGKSSFSEVTLERLIDELEIQYDIKIQIGDVDTKRIFTGFFVHHLKKIKL